MRADDPIPAYRLSASSKLPGRGTLAARWRAALEDVLTEIAREELVVDLDSVDCFTYADYVEALKRAGTRDEFIAEAPGS